MPKKSEYLKDLEIDFSKLEINLQEQPQLYMKYAELYIDAVSERDRLKEKLDIERSKLDSKIRKDPDKYLPGKLTEASVSSCISINAEIQQLNGDLIDKNKVINLYAASKTAFDYRMKSMSKQVDLYVAGYWIKPKLTKEKKEVLGKRERHETHKKGLGKSQLKRRKKGEN